MESPSHMMSSQIVKEALVQSVPARQDFVLVGLLHRTVSQSMVRATLLVTDTQCVARYQVDATPTGGTVSTSLSTDSTLNVTGLNVCENNYTLTGSVLTADGVQSNLSSPISFTANLSGTFNYRAGSEANNRTT